MITASWILYAILVGGLFTLAAGLLSRVTSRSGRPSRWVWAVAGLSTVVVPLLALARPPATSRPIFPVGPGWEWPVSGGAGAARSAAVPAAATESTDTDPDQLLLLGWLLASLATGLWVLRSQWTLARRRGSWRLDSLMGTEVLVAPSFGPAVVGVVRPAIVIPEWLRELPPEAQALGLTHEVEHVRAHDSRLLAALLTAVVVMPWHPFLWIQLAALRLAIEIDCDRRVLRAMPRPGRYAELLLALAGRMRGNSWAIPLVTLWSPPSALARRIRLMCDTTAIGRGEWAGLTSLAAAALVLACSAKAPSSAPAPAPEPVTRSAIDEARAEEWARWERKLARYFQPPADHRQYQHVYWFVTDKEGAMVRHDTGGRDIIWRDDRYWQTFRPESYRRARAHADSAGRKGPLGGYFQVSGGEIYERFPDLRGRDIVEYGLTPARFGGDTVMIAFGTVSVAPQ